MVTLPERSKKYGVGKEIGGKIYMHIFYAHTLLKALPYFVAAEDRLEEIKVVEWINARFNIVSCEFATGNVTFTVCDDFETADEPTVGTQILIKPDLTYTIFHHENNPFVYHHKWLMVRDDCVRFNVEESKKRSETWMALPDIGYCMIGRKSYWERNVVARLEFGIGMNELDSILDDLKAEYEGDPCRGGSCQWCEATESEIEKRWGETGTLGHDPSCQWQKSARICKSLLKIKEKMNEKYGS